MEIFILKNAFSIWIQKAKYLNNRPHNIVTFRTCSIISLSKMQYLPLNQQNNSFHF